MLSHQFFQCLQYNQKDTENKHVVCRGKDCMKKLCKYFREKFLTELAEECEGQSNCFGKYTEKYITFIENR